MNSNADWTAHGRTSPASTNAASRSCSPVAPEEGGRHLIGNEGRITLPDLADRARIVARRAPRPKPTPTGLVSPAALLRQIGIAFAHTPGLSTAGSSLMPPDRHC